ncbi:MAG: acyl-CoA dehydrogenase [Pseudomonadota bacterium]
MNYSSPMEDIMFCVEHLSHWPELSAMAAYPDIELDDVDAVLAGFSRFCSEKIAPLSQSGDRVGPNFDQGKVSMPEAYRQAYAQFVEMGWQSLPHSAEHGGMGLPKVAGAAALEMLNAADMSFGLCPLLTDGAIEALQITGSQAQKDAYLGPLVSGVWSGTMNLTEPQAGSDLGLVKTKAVPAGDGTYQISGTKIYITYGAHDLSENIIHLVLARTADAPEGPKGLSLFLVPQKLVNSDGSLGDVNSVTCVSLEHKLGVRASPTAFLDYQQATGFLIGEENAGLRYMFIMMNAARFAVGIQGVATCDRAYQRALNFAKDRVQSRPVNGSTTEAVAIIEHPDVRRMLMRMRALTEGGRALSMATAGYLDIAQHSPDPAHQHLAEFFVPLVKASCTERAVEVASLGIQIHGGMGFIEETGAAQHYRDARILPIYEGTTAIQANDLLGRKVLRDDGATARQFLSLVQQTETELHGQNDADAAIIAQCLAEAREDFADALEWLLETKSEDIDGVYAGSVPFLTMAGTLACGWQLGRAAIAALKERPQTGRADFLNEKIMTARFFAEHILAETGVDAKRVMRGSTSVLGGFSRDLNSIQ